jgi:alpha-beta hydrolase superfamily lysophospholipase
LTSASRAIYLVHGISEHSGRYALLAQWLADRGWHVGAHDHHGFGRSGGTRGRLRSASAYVDDTLQCFEAFAEETGVTPVLLGHSMGGVIAAATVLLANARVAGLVLSAPAFLPSFSLSQRWQLELMRRLAPDYVIERSLDPRKLTHDAGIAQAYRDDPLVHGFVSARLVQWIVDHGGQCLARAGAIDVPLLMLAAGTDPVINPDGVRQFAGAVPAELLSEHWYDGYLHEVLNEEPARRALVYSDLLTWLNKRAIAPMK